MHPAVAGRSAQVRYPLGGKLRETEPAARPRDPRGNGALASSYYLDVGGRRSVGFVEDCLAQVKRAVGGRDISVLDVGCGTGELLRVLAAMVGVKVLGVDVDEVSVEAARAICAGLDNVELRVGTIQSAVGGGTFDVVVLTQVLDHIPDVEAVLEQVARSVAPSGRVLIGISNGYGLYELSKALPRWLRDLSWLASERLRQLRARPYTRNTHSPHLRRYSLSRLREQLEGAGLQIEQVLNTTFALPAFPFCLAFYALPRWIGDMLEDLDHSMARRLPAKLASNWYLSCTRATGTSHPRWQCTATP